MALLLYKKFLKKKTPESFELCLHQQELNIVRPSEQDDHSRLPSHGSSPPTNPILEKSLNQPLKSEATPIGPCTICRAEERAANVYRWRLIVGLFFPFSVQALDTTMIAGALPFIASDFHELSQLNWIVSASALTSAAFIPFWGQIADVFGRYVAMQGSLIVTIIGSTLCSAAPTNAFPMLLTGRALQGAGCAGLLILTKIILADKVSLKENAKNNTIFTIIAGCSFGFGPTIGGHLTEVSWRWCFILNIPLCVIGLILVHFVLRSEVLGPQKIIIKEDNEERELPPTFTIKVCTIDFGGLFFFLFGIGLLVLSLTWAGSYYPWSDVEVIVPLAIACVLILAFICWEYFLMPGNALAHRFPTQKPMIPLRLLWKRDSGLLMYINFVTGMALEAVFYFVGLYFALVRKNEPGDSGTNLLYYLPGLAAGAYAAMFACNIWPLQTFFPILFGTILEPLGITLIAVAIRQGNIHLVYGMLALTGVGTGIRLMPGVLHGVGYFPTSISSIVSLMSLSISLGGTISTTIMLNIFNNYLRQNDITFHTSSASSFEAISRLPAEAQAVLREKASNGLSLAFFALTAFLWLGVLAALGLGNVKIGKKGKDGVMVEDRAIEGSFLGSLVFGKSSSAEKARESQMER